MRFWCWKSHRSIALSSLCKSGNPSSKMTSHEEECALSKYEECMKLIDTLLSVNSRWILSNKQRPECFVRIGVMIKRHPARTKKFKTDSRPCLTIHKPHLKHCLLGSSQSRTCWESSSQKIIKLTITIILDATFHRLTHVINSESFTKVSQTKRIFCKLPNDHCYYFEQAYYSLFLSQRRKKRIPAEIQSRPCKKSVLEK